MDTASTFAMGYANRNSRPRVFDWDRAAALIKEKQPTQASAGLGGDWEYTGGTIFRDGQPITDRDDTYTFLSSTWAIPELDLDGDVQPCWRWKDETSWDSETLWPESALFILKGV